MSCDVNYKISQICFRPISHRVIIMRSLILSFPLFANTQNLLSNWEWKSVFIPITALISLLYDFSDEISFFKYIRSPHCGYFKKTVPNVDPFKHSLFKSRDAVILSFISRKSSKNKFYNIFHTHLQSIVWKKSNNYNFFLLNVRKTFFLSFSSFHHILFLLSLYYTCLKKI